MRERIIVIFANPTCGKSTLQQTLQQQGHVVIDSDEVIHEHHAWWRTDAGWRATRDPAEAAAYARAFLGQTLEIAEAIGATVVLSNLSEAVDVAVDAGCSVFAAYRADPDSCKKHWIRRGSYGPPPKWMNESADSLRSKYERRFSRIRSLGHPVVELGPDDYLTAEVFALFRAFIG